MIYCHCDNCGMRFRKGRKKQPVCPRCGNDDLWESDIPKEDLTLSDLIADEEIDNRK